MTIRQAVFLVGGKGTRLGAIAKLTPKPLLEIAPGLRFLDVVLEEAARQGFTDIVLLAGHLGEQVQNAYQGRRIRGAVVEVICETKPAGTGGALRVGASRLAPWFLMGNGDSLFDINLRALAAAPSADFDARLALREVADPARYGAVELDGDRIVRFREKNLDLQGPALINGGLYVVRRDGVLSFAFGESADRACSIEQDIFPKLASVGRLQGRRYDGYFLDIGLPDTFTQAQQEIPRRRRPAAFLDRDGTINIDRGYTHRPEDLAFTDGAIDAIRMLNDAGYLVIVVTNQAGVARGYYTEADVGAFHAAMAEKLAAAGAFVDAFYVCPHHADAVRDQYRHPDHPERKPNPGMLWRAMAEWSIDQSRSFMIGDQPSDIAAAAAAGVPARLFAGGSLAAAVEDMLAKSQRRT